MSPYLNYAMTLYHHKNKFCYIPEHEDNLVLNKLIALDAELERVTPFDDSNRVESFGGSESSLLKKVTRVESFVKKRKMTRVESLKSDSSRVTSLEKCS